MSAMLGYIPFLHPINFFHDLWMIYKALRMNDLTRFWRGVASTTLQIILGMIGLALVLMFLVQVVIPALPVD